MRQLSFLLGIASAILLAGCSCDFFGSSHPDAGPRDSGVGDPCTEDLSCRMGLVCGAGGTCQPPGTGLEGSVCVFSADCMDGLYCDAGRTCAAAGVGADGADCTGTADCLQGFLCGPEGFGFRCREAGGGDLGDACTAELDCLAGLSCLPVPSGDLQCGSPPLGDGGVAPRPPLIPRWPGETCAVDEGPPTAYFAVPRGDGTDRDFYRLPFPNDVRRTASGLDLSGHATPGDALSLDVLGRTIAAAEEDLDGFATNPVIYFRFSRPYEWSDVTGERVLLIDLTPTSPEYGANVGRSWLTTSGPITRYICPNWLAVRRGHGAPLRAGTTYATILLRGIRTDESGGHLDFERSADLDQLLSPVPPTVEPLASAYAKYAPLRGWLTGVDTPAAAEVLDATVFTTQDPTAVVRGLRTVIRSGPAPTVRDVTVCDAGVTSPCDDGEARRCSPANPDFWEIHARIDLPQFQQGTPPFETPEDGGGIASAAGLPIVARTESVCMMMTIPKLASAPTSGFPVVIYAHGTGGAFTAPIGNGLARTFAVDDGGGGAPRAVTIGLDMPLHGSRRGDSTRSPDVLVFNFANPRAARDNFLQGAADLMSVVYWAESYVLAAADAPTDFDVLFDPSRIAVWGHSQGATHAQLIVAHETSLVAALLSGAGGDLTESLLTKTRPVNIAAAVPLALLDVDGSGALVAQDNHPALALFQMFYERVDPVNFGRHVYAEPIGGVSRHVFMTYGIGDSYSTERTLSAYARSARFPIASPVLNDVGLGMAVAPPVSGNITVAGTPFTIAMRQYMPDAGDDGHFVATQTTDGRADTTRFMLEALAGRTPPIGE